MTAPNLPSIVRVLSMLSFFRRGITAKIMLGVLGIGLFAIVVTGFGTGGSGIGGLGALGSGSIASVEGEAISSVRVTDETQRQLARMRERQPELDMASFLRRGSLEEVVDQLIGIFATVTFGKDQGLAAPRQLIDREIASIPGFQNMAGQFDQATFQRALAQEKLTEQQLREEIETRLIQRQLILPAAGSAYVPQGLAFQYASLLLESRTGIVGAVPAEAMGPGREPSDAEVAAFFRENQSRYTIPERRVLRYALFGRENVAAQAKATDAEIVAAYQNNQASFGPKETRSLSQIVVQDEAAARRAAQQIAGGTSFAQAAQQAGFSAADASLGEQTREAFARVSSAEVAAAAFAAARGATVGPIRSPLGWHLVRVDDIKSTPARPLAAVRNEIAAQIEGQKAQNAIGDLAGRIETALAEGSSFEEIARTERLAVRETAPITATGASPDNPAFQTPPELRTVLKTAFEMDPDEDPVVESIVPNERFAIIAIARAVPAAPPPLQQIAARVKADLIARRASDRARSVATAIVARINAGMAPAQAFAQAEMRLPPTQSLTATRREIARGGEQVPPPLAMMFSLPRGKARLLPAPNGRGWFIVYLDKIVPGDASREPGLTEAVKSQFAQVLGDEYAQQFTAAIRARAKIKRDEDALKKLKAQLMGTGSTVQ
jgi:peptidyl-prolyl cis-trans isomerase D